MGNNSCRIVYMGTPEFAVPPLKALVDKGFDIAAVITAPDKPSGRGLKVSQSAVKVYSLEQGLNILQPRNLKDPAFQAELKGLKADLQVVVAFRMLPQEVWSYPPMGTINLHASLLPDYRGAAPINWAVINGEKETGLTTFFIRQEIDTGEIIFQEKISIGENETAGELHDRLMARGGLLVLKTVEALCHGDVSTSPQVINADEIKQAPKIFKETCRINWELSSEKIHNLIRGLSPYPVAWTMFGDKQLKIYFSLPEIGSHDVKPGTILTDNKTYLKVAASDGYIHVNELQLQGKKRMKTRDFLNGVNVPPDSRLH